VLDHDHGVAVIDEPVPGIDTPLGAETAAPDQGAPDQGS